MKLKKEDRNCMLQVNYRRFIVYIFVKIPCLMVGWAAAAPKAEVTSSKSIAKKVANEMNLEAPSIAIFNYTLLSFSMECISL